MFPSRIASVLGGGAGLQNNYSLDFDGTDDHVLNTALNVSHAQLSISLWIYGTSAGGAGHLFGAQASDILNVYMRFGNSGTFVFRYGDNGNSVAPDTAFTENEWHHAVFISDSTNNLVQVYQNGVQIVSEAATFDEPIYNDGFLIGARGAVGGPNAYFDGNIDEFLIYNKALSAGDVFALYQARGTSDLNDDGNSANLQAWWRMGDGTEGAVGTTIYDMSANSYNGTMTNMDAADFVKDTP